MDWHKSFIAYREPSPKNQQNIQIVIAIQDGGLHCIDISKKLRGTERRLLGKKLA